MTRNRLLFLRAAQAGYNTWANTLFDYARTFVSWSLRPKWRDRRDMRGVMWQACRDFSAGRFGQAAR
jgi:hypothetical protein